MPKKKKKPKLKCLTKYLLTLEQYIQVNHCYHIYITQTPELECLIEYLLSPKPYILSRSCEWTPAIATVDRKKYVH